MQLSSSGGGVHGYACSLVYSELSRWGLKSSFLYMSHMCTIAVTTALDQHINAAASCGKCRSVSHNYRQVRDLAWKRGLHAKESA
jgi:hypothetical protein